MRRVYSAVRKLLQVLLLCIAQVDQPFAQTAPSKPVLLEQCALNAGASKARERGPALPPMAAAKDVKAQCTQLLTEIEREETAKTEALWNQGKANGRSYAFDAERKWDLEERQWPLRVRLAVAFAVDGGAEKAREEFSMVIDHLVGGDIGVLDRLTPSSDKAENARLHEIGWVLLARSALEGGDKQDKVADLQRVVKLAPQGLDEKVLNRSAYVPLGLDGSPMAIAGRLKQEQGQNNEELVMSLKRKAQDDLVQSLKEYYVAMTASIEVQKEHAKRAAMYFNAASRYREQLMKCLRGYWTCGLFRDRALEEGEKTIREALAARDDAKEAAKYGSQLEKLIADALLLRAECRVVPEKDARAADVSISIKEVEEAIGLARPLGDDAKKIDALLQSLKQLLKQKSL